MNIFFFFTESHLLKMKKKHFKREDSIYFIFLNNLFIIQYLSIFVYSMFKNRGLLMFIMRHNGIIILGFDNLYYIIIILTCV